MKTKILYLKQFKYYFKKNLWKTIQVIHVTYITHILKFIFEACKKYFFINFFVYIKNGKEKGEERPGTDIKIFLKKKKNCQYHCDWNKNLSEEEKQKKVEYMRNYYLAHKK